MSRPSPRAQQKKTLDESFIPVKGTNACLMLTENAIPLSGDVSGIFKRGTSCRLIFDLLALN